MSERPALIEIREAIIKTLDYDIDWAKGIGENLHNATDHLHASLARLHEIEQVLEKTGKL